MTAQPRPLLPLVAALVLGGAVAGCAGAPSSDYPSLAIRDVERATGTLAPPPAPPPPPAPLAPEAAEELGRLQAQAAQAHARFLAAAPGARGTVSAAAGADPGAESWARAQVALAGLEAIRSQAMVPMADLDRLFVDTATSGGTLEPIAGVREEVAALIEEEDALIASLAAGLR